jgi:abortive infection bacteriophage resistance protein
MATKLPFNKKALSSQDLIRKLKDQGLIVQDQILALKYMNYVGHYRLKGYWYQLQDHETKTFIPGTTFKEIIDRYEMDREIRAIIFESVERLEVAVRTIICNHLSLKYSPHWYLRSDIFANRRNSRIEDIWLKIKEEVDRSYKHKKEFIVSYYRKYDQPCLPPSWAMSECVSFGIWSKIFSLLCDPADKKSISSKFGIRNTDVFESWLHTLSVLRNMAAHHDRILENRLGVGPKNYEFGKISFSDNKSVYAALTMTHVLLKSIWRNGGLNERMTNLENTYGSDLFCKLGFPKNWRISSAGWG